MISKLKIVMRILVTGVAGFIGSHLCSSLLGRGFEVWGLDDLSRGDRGRVKELEELGLRFVRVDIRDRVEVEKALREARPVGVAHLAALISVPESFEKPDLYMAVNVEGTRNLVSAANEVGVERFVYASSAAVYGNPVRLPIDEEHPTKPISPYGESKLLGEKCVLNEFRGSAFSLRLFNVYGRGQNPEYAGVITKFLERVSRGEPPIIYGDGEQTRDFVYVGDVADAFIQALTSNLRGAYVFNIGTGNAVTINQLARIIIELAGLNVEPIYADPRPGDIRHSYANISRIKSVLGWQPKISLEEGLKRLVENLRSG